MRITFENTTFAGNNVRTEMFFDGDRVSELHMNKAQYRLWREFMTIGNDQHPTVTVEFVS